MFVKNIAFAALSAGAVYAQVSSETPTTAGSGTFPTSNISPCVLTCSASSTLCAFADPTCICDNIQYEQAVIQCLRSQCTAEDVAQAAAIQSAICASSSGVPSTPAPSGTSRPSSSVSGTKSGSPSPSSSGGGAASLSTSILATGGAVFLGVICGGLLVF